VWRWTWEFPALRILLKYWFLLRARATLRWKIDPIKFPQLCIDNVNAYVYSICILIASTPNRARGCTHVLMTCIATNFQLLALTVSSKGSEEWNRLFLKINWDSCIFVPPRTNRYQDAVKISSAQYSAFSVKIFSHFKAVVSKFYTVALCHLNKESIATSSLTLFILWRGA
jgi:hypothetical protein